MLRAIAAAKKKNDSIDASKIADCLRCDFLPECYMAPTEIRERRRTLRYRHLLVRQMVQMKNRVSGLLMQTGVSHNKQRLHKVGYFPELLANADAVNASIRPLLQLSRESTTRLQRTEGAIIRSLQRDRGMALVLVTHNMGVVAETARRVIVMYAGQIVEERDTAGLFRASQHPYTAALLAARPEHGESGRLATIPGVPPGLHDRPRGCLFGPR